ncbi:23S rRNA (cytidine(2498)-2'-O)-methyltransferase RlmM [Hahella sp. CCB-MM4]|uniref:23S rRNA (cytidine(2498)-2'-O)-methyltransferase RlmM n=1 Tax=Hahella sp. (strain CCB-MM4) TaxID=1926491 RepID=UPI000B9A606F|nr:23S rRNA (cytidine(2498)-2'-O)-methyltransferase RlmM [Hahella sp. CCB-MM4]OZG73730.1 23S rRNA (cytidine(2498)-2'-O)-methyltransferase RlmM [Hahella sp. CCB-MM4]
MYQKLKTTGLLAYCRKGFEKECLQELQSVAGQRLVYGYSAIQEHQGWVYWKVSQGDVGKLYGEIEADKLVFSRQLYLVVGEVEAESPKDRVSPVVSALRDSGGRFGYLSVEAPGDDEKGSLRTLSKKLVAPMSAAMKSQGMLSAKPDSRLPTCFVVCLSGQHFILAVGASPTLSAFAEGIPRLRFDAEAPSRSALKIEEAFMVMLSPHEKSFVLKRGQKGVDLGAAPGGWTWYMVNQGVKMTAVDHGALAPSLMQDADVSYVAADGYVYKPGRSVDWVVCDIVDKPMRTLERMADWLVYGWSRYALFNLKLPMKTRFDAVEACLQKLQERLESANIEAEVRIKQLYHDREEVTVIVLTAPFPDATH